MEILQRLRARFKRTGKLEKSFAAVLLLYIGVRFALPNTFLAPVVAVLLIVLGVWLVFRVVRTAIRKAIWRLRNRLLVTYLFIAVVPVLLIITLAGLGAYALASQIAVYLATSEIDRKVGSMQTATDALARTEPPLLKDVMRRLGEIYEDKYPGMVMLVENRTSVLRWPEDSTITPPAKGWSDVSGVAFLDARYYAWSRVMRDGVAITSAVPLRRRFLSEMVPGLGEVYFLDMSGRTRLGARGTPRPSTNAGNGANVNLTDVRPAARETASSTIPPPANRFDIPVQWISLTPASDWETPGKSDFGLLLVRTRFSALYDIVSSRKADEVQGLLPFIVLAVGILFLVVEGVALIIGTSLTRTVTRAVHSLYEGTQRVMRSDFSHRIKVEGRDQLAELGTSFNSMTENLERLLVVAKEKERLQAEIEIAREVQEQLYPKTAPTVRTLRVTGLCQPARMVSGDYYDFQRLHENKLAIAIGDVAGKGISAALLMATIQSAMRMELRSSIELAAPSHQPVNGLRLSTARMVSDLNQQLYATTSPEKYATFYFGLYDEIGGELTYTNAGHLPPILIRKGRPERLDINGTVVGAFPRSVYEESRVQMESGDLLICYTDGITEPENEYGEMFGEERLIDLAVKNIERDDSRIVELIMDAVRQWTSSPELQDDMTVLLARKQ
jgi:sigma-B regulation protein RsbU (phosphoserine phosphatase)